MTSVFASSETPGAPPADSTIQALPQETSRTELSQSVGQAAHDPDVTFDYFQAQGRRDAITLEGRGA
jgi:hypothetical protein